jgi:hypothetical protein
MAVPMAGGVALGAAATSAVISGGMNVAREVKGAIDDEISQMAEEIAETAKKFYEQRGWL